MLSQIWRFASAKRCRGGNRRLCLCGASNYVGPMELFLIIIGGTLTTAIIFMVIDRLRGEFSEDDDAIVPGDFHEKFPERKRRD